MRVLDLFAVPGPVRPLPGGQGGSVVAGDLVLSPGRDPVLADWLSPPLARLAVELDGAAARSLRVAVPVPARDGSWVVDGWAASRYEPDTTACHDLSVLVATGRLLHAHFARSFQQRPPLEERTDPWAVAERLAFATPEALGDAVAPHDPRHGLLTEVATSLELALVGNGPGTGNGRGAVAAAGGGPPPAPDQLVHGDLAGNVLLDARGVPVVIDVSPYWRPALWAEAVCVLDAVLWLGAEPDALEEWGTGAGREAMVRAIAFRVLSDGPGCDTERYRAALRRSAG